MQIVENLDAWQAAYEQDWLAHFNATGEIDWKRYPKLNNQHAPAGPGVDLAQSRLMLISTAGGYLADSQAPFDAANPLGDYSIRTFPVTTGFDQIAYAHEHFDHAAVNEDPEVLLPLQHLATMVEEGAIGELAPSVVNFCGYQPDVGQVVDVTIPAILDVATAEQVDAVLLVPA